jgi:tetratricopeptide (TPR) repeat protein
VLGYVVQVVCPGLRPDGESDCTVVDHVKLIRNHHGLEFEGRIHEQILPAIRCRGGDIEWSDLQVVHSGSDQSSAGRKRKQERDLRILLLELAERPRHPFTLFNLGMTYADIGDHVQAIPFLQSSIEQSSLNDSHLRKAYSLLVNSYIQSGNLVAAETECRHGRAAFPDDPELLFRHAMLAHSGKRWEEAEQAYCRLIHYRGERYLSSVDPTITGYKARHNLAALYQDMGRPELAELQWREVVRELPEYRAGWRGLIDTFIRLGRCNAAQAAIDHMLEIPSMRGTAHLSRAQVLEAQGDLVAAKSEILAAIHEEPASVPPVEALCRLLFEHGDPFEAKLALKELAERAPDAAPVFHNLGAVNMRLGQYRQAVCAYENSLRLRPDCVPTLHELASALRSTGRGEESNAVAAQVEQLTCGGMIE